MKFNLINYLFLSNFVWREMNLGGFTVDHNNEKRLVDIAQDSPSLGQTFRRPPWR